MVGVEFLTDHCELVLIFLDDGSYLGEEVSLFEEIFIQFLAFSSLSI